MRPSLVPFSDSIVEQWRWRACARLSLWGYEQAPRSSSRRSRVQALLQRGLYRPRWERILAIFVSAPPAQNHDRVALRLTAWCLAIGFSQPALASGDARDPPSARRLRTAFRHPRGDEEPINPEGKHDD